MKVGLQTMVCCGFELGLFEHCTRDRCDSFSKVAIVLAVLGRNSLIVVCFASGLVVAMEGILVVDSPLAGLAGLRHALRRGCHSRWGEVGYHSWSLEDAMCHLKDSIDGGFGFGGSAVAAPRSLPWFALWRFSDR